MTCCGIDLWPSKRQMIKILEENNYNIDVGKYAIRIESNSEMAFQAYGGDLGDPQFEAENESRELLEEDIKTLSAVLKKYDIKHCFEIYEQNESENLVTYIHHQYPAPPSLQNILDKQNKKQS